MSYEFKFDPSVWGPHYWFFLHTIAESYPLHPNNITKRKYYDLLQNFPLFLPNDEIGNRFSVLLDRYPVSPYLDNRDSFVRWVHFIHNKVNLELGKEEITLVESLARYRAQYKPKTIVLSDAISMKKHMIFAVFILVCCGLIYVYYE